MPKVSVVLPTYQRAHLLGETVAGLLRQTLADIEVIVADDGSTDETPEVVGNFKDPRVRYVRREHLGMPLILNEGFAAAQGQYIMTCHDHDIYDPTLLEELAGVLDRHPSATYAHCGNVLVDASGRRELVYQVPDYPELFPGGAFLIEELLPISPVSATSMVRASVLGGAGLDARFGGVADIELWLRLSTVGDVAYVKKPLIRIRQRDASSKFYSSGWKLAATVLEIKKTYLRRVEDSSRRTAICNRWRKEVDGTSLLELLKVLEARRYEEIPSIVEFVRQEGTHNGANLVFFLSYLPRGLALGILRSLRLLYRERLRWRMARTKGALYMKTLLSRPYRPSDMGKTERRCPNR